MYKAFVLGDGFISNSGRSSDLDILNYMLEDMGEDPFLPENLDKSNDSEVQEKINEVIFNPRYSFSTAILDRARYRWAGKHVNHVNPDPFLVLPEHADTYVVTSIERNAYKMATELYERSNGENLRINGVFGPEFEEYCGKLIGFFHFEDAMERLRSVFSAKRFKKDDVLFLGEFQEKPEGVHFENYGDLSGIF